jgi:hypothetical protein
MADPVNNNTNQRTSSASEGKKEFKTGPFVAIVRNHLDSTYMGGLEVELLSASDSGNSTNAPGQLIPVKYLSPYYGITSYDGTSKNSSASNSQRSYGFWGVPPDIGAKVLVIFAEGGDGYWMGCIPEEHTNLMTPDPWVSTTFNDSNKSKKLPVVEYNKKTEKGTSRDSTQFIKPTNTDAVNTLTTQGLIDDEIRGTTSSSSRREIPSTVVGLSSPGPQDRRPGAPRVNYGENYAQTSVPQNRLGGSSLVFDDGDASLLRKTPASSGPPIYVNAEKGEKGGDPTLPHNDLVRLRTRTGHQILLHNTEDLIYIGNAKGTTWIELTSNGKIDIFAQDSVSVHTSADFNVKADGNVNIEAGGDINLKAGGDGRLTAANTHIKAGTTFIDQNLKVNGALNVTGNIGTPSTVNAGTLSAPTTNTSVSPGGSAGAGGSAATEALPSQRVPEHEPWAGHENLFNVAAKTADTFKKSVKREVTAKPAVASGADDSAAAQNTAAAKKEKETGVTKPTAPTAIPDKVAEATNAVKTNMSSASVGGLINSVANAGAMAFSTVQGIVKDIDTKIGGSSFLKSIANVGGAIVQDVANAASDMLGLRTTLAKGLTPTPLIQVPQVNAANAYGSESDRKIIADVGSGAIKSGQTVTMANGDKLSVTEVDGKPTLSKVG